MKLRKFCSCDVGYFARLHVELSLRSASVDLETDNKIQHTIRTEFRDRTLLCIARARISFFVSSAVNTEFQIVCVPSSHTIVSL